VPEKERRKNMTSPDTQAQQYRQYLLDPRWKAVRAQIIVRDAHRCKSCGSTQSLQVHHRQYHAFRITGVWKKPWEYEAQLLVTLCETCHMTGHSRYQIPVFSI